MEKKIKKTITKLLMSAGLGIVLLSGCGTSTPSENPPSPQPPIDGPSAPVTDETIITTTNGEVIPIKIIFQGYEGKPVLLEFYGDTCPHCIEAISYYNNLQAKYGNNILILTINAPGPYATLDNAGLQSFVSSHGITYKTVSQEYQGNMKAYAESLVGTMPGVPYAIMINKNGVISSQALAPTEAELESFILDVL